MNIKAKLIRVIALSVLIISSRLVFISWASPENQDNFVQPIAYNHKLHIEDIGFTCLDCHSNAETHARASIPNIEFCGGCHDDTEVENPEEKKVAEHVNNDIQIKWIQVHTVPDHAYFSHRRHVKLARIECETCHGEVSQMESAFVKPFVSMKMSWCMDCHAQRGISTDCYACHR